MSIKGLGKFPISSAWCRSNVLRGVIRYETSSNELEMMMDNYFFGLSTLKRWDGTQWAIDSAVKTYNGSQFVKKPLKMWENGEWKSVNSNN